MPLVSPTFPTQAPPTGSVLADRVQRFLDACEIDRNFSARTIRQYRYYLDFLLDWLVTSESAVIDLPDVTLDVVRRYKLALARHVNEHTRRPLTRATQIYFLVALRSLLRYWAREGLEVLAPDRIELGKSESRSLKFLDTDQLQRLLSAPDINDPRGLRDRALLETFFSTGLRLS
ncbi:MAG TPA: site-specific integrase, partial [Candidatus Dormibacteraeota bacterium]